MTPDQKVSASEAQAAVYETRAAEYEALISAEDADRALPEVLDRLVRIDGARIADVGAGTGRFARLLAGQRLSIPVSLPPGRCATFLAQGGLGVIEIDLFLTTSAVGTVPGFLASEVTSGPVAVIGGRRGCLPAPQGAPSELTLHAIVRRGEGAVLLQAFARDTPARP